MGREEFARARMAAALLLVLMAIAGVGCFSLRIETRVNDPEPAFAKAQAEIAAIHKRNPQRAGRPRRLCVLVYDRQERQLVKLKVPMWIFKAGLEAGARASGLEGRDFGLEERYNGDWRSIKDLSRVGPGLLVEVVDEKSRVLIWLK